MNFERSSGILLHPTSLPSHYGIGELGKEAYSFIDFLNQAGQKIWQTFPLGPTGYGDSPYQCFSAFAGNPLLISLDILAEKGYLNPSDIVPLYQSEIMDIDFGKVIHAKYPVLQHAFSRYSKLASSAEKQNFEAYRQKHARWLDDFSLFMALKSHYGGQVWTEWESRLVHREPEAIREYQQKLRTEILFHQFLQYEFFTQWQNLKHYANQKGIKIIGDLPIFVAHDSSDVWSHPELFYLKSNGKPDKVAGVPPDYFSKTGQLWGNPHYRWDLMEKTDFSWWIDRFTSLYELSDILRIDHFRGFEAYWEVDGDALTAEHGKWVKSPGENLFRTVQKKLGRLPIIAEDLGVITPEVDALRNQFNFPGMKVLQFAFDSGPANIFMPHNFLPNYIVFTGTHDNDTTLGWYVSRLGQEKEYVDQYLDTDRNRICWDMIRLAIASCAVISIIPMQDILGLNNEARMNYPGRLGGNWKWRLKNIELSEYARKLRFFCQIYGRI